MFGYIAINKNELKIKDYNYYRACYCGLCDSLKKRHGVFAPMTLSYDMTFLVLLLTGLYETAQKEGQKRCMVHAGQKVAIRQNKWSEYAADMTVLLAYYNMLDDWQDEKKFAKLLGARALKKAFLKVQKEYPAQAKAVYDYIKKTKGLERQISSSIDDVAGLTGNVLREIFAFQEDEWQEKLGNMAFYLGKFIYLMDAYDDMDEDIKKKNYNVLLAYRERQDFEAWIENTLILMMADCSREFEYLPIVQNVELLRNILYSGVWMRYAQVKEKRRTEKIKKEKRKK